MVNERIFIFETESKIINDMTVTVDLDEIVTNDEMIATIVSDAETQFTKNMDDLFKTHKMTSQKTTSTYEEFDRLIRCIQYKFTTTTIENLLINDKEVRVHIHTFHDNPYYQV